MTTLQVGQLASIKCTFDQSDFDRFAALSGDDNPIHVDPVFSARTKFGRTVAHGMFLYSVACSVLGTQLPGPGTMQVYQELMFPSATYAGEEVTVQVEVSQVWPDEGLADLATRVIRPGGSLGLQGRTLVRLPGYPAQVGSGGMPANPAGTQAASHPSSPSTLGAFHLGQTAATRRTFTPGDLAEYADLTGDTNLLFSDAAYAQQLGLEGPPIPGALLGALFSYLLGTELPGPGTNYLKQTLEFLAPAYTGQELTATVEVVRLRPDKHLVNLGTWAETGSASTAGGGAAACKGEALVLVSDVEPLFSTTRT